MLLGSTIWFRRVSPCCLSTFINKNSAMQLLRVTLISHTAIMFAGPNLEDHLVKAAFNYSQTQQIPLAAFLGDTCATLQMHPELEVIFQPTPSICLNLDQQQFTWEAWNLKSGKLQSTIEKLDLRLFQEYVTRNMISKHTILHLNLTGLKELVSVFALRRYSLQSLICVFL